MKFHMEKSYFSSFSLFVASKNRAYQKNN